MTSRYEELDSLRGLAALSVFFSHMLLIFKGSLFSTLLFEYGPLRFMVAGSEAVTLFFVLSGFVLSLPFYSNKKSNYITYAIKRFCRIYVPYIAAIMISLLFWNMFYSGKISSFSDWFNVNWSYPLNISSLINHLLLIKTFTSNLNNVVWSLVHEMRISLIFPFIMFLLVRMNLKQTIGMGVLLSVLSLIYATVTNAPFIGTELYATVHYTSIFILGALLAKYRYSITSKLLNIQTKFKICLLSFGFIFYLYAHPSFILNIVFHGFNPYYRTVIDSWFTAFGASIIIVFSISSARFAHVLKNKAINYIGKISYSLYLTHLVVLFSCIHLLHGVIPTWAICLVVLVLTFVMSSSMYYLVERPSMKLGKNISRILSLNSKHKTIATSPNTKSL
ncbi:acyltransferase family protein [Paenibacillus sp. sgz302251]|uniref:acyltransferase family protein n=1 Tax=Paenibacillus sp. sgz302251 TaxID=3414493 RepID=UPI003C7A9564